MLTSLREQRKGSCHRALTREASAAAKVNYMSKVFLHVTVPSETPNWENSSQTFLRLPTIGEYVATGESSPWYKVVLVVHCAFEAAFAAEIYAVEVNHHEEIQIALRSFK